LVRSSTLQYLPGFLSASIHTAANSYATFKRTIYGFAAVAKDIVSTMSWSVQKLSTAVAGQLLSNKTVFGIRKKFKDGIRGTSRAAGSYR